MSVDTVRQWERGRHHPYQVNIQQLCTLFQMSPEELGLLHNGASSPPRIPNIFGTPGMSTASEEEKRAAWTMYVELVTRVPIAPFGHNEGILREALTSIYSLFHVARAILSNYGPTIPHTNQDTRLSFSHLVIRMLNTTLRPLLSKWHPLLMDYEVTRPDSMGVRQYEQQWERYAELRTEIMAVRKILIEYVNAFAQIAGTSPLIIDTPDDIQPQEERVHKKHEKDGES
ncbi:MAG: hypothetical protein PVS3B1_07680 [Ktedonobacteraceae bacterium]